MNPKLENDPSDPPTELKMPTFGHIRFRSRPPEVAEINAKCP